MSKTFTNLNIWVSLLILNTVFISHQLMAKDNLDPLPSWQEGINKQIIIKFVNDVTQIDSPDFVAIHERVATFDNDGTLWAEQPIYAQLMFAVERIYALASEHPQWQTQQPFAKLLKGDIKGAFSHDKHAVNTIVMAANTGMSDEIYTDIVKTWIATAKHPVSQRLLTDMLYQPMLELIAYLQKNEFKTYIVSGGGSQFIRAWSQDVYGIPPEQVIGSTMKRSYQMQGGKHVIVREAEMDFYNNKSNKVIAINTHIGQRPIAAFGNSDGDMQMLSYVTEGSGARLAMIIHHTDEKREWAYDRQSPIGRLDKALNKAETNGWKVVSIKDDWNIIHPVINK
jgi:phosphoserine phosphatase|tara:strand:- start:304 stop:1320 length:1017 start_codon:yes stop_codon:yes gene_type:complete